MSIRLLRAPFCASNCSLYAGPTVWMVSGPLFVPAGNLKELRTGPRRLRQVCFSSWHTCTSTEKNPSLEFRSKFVFNFSSNQTTQINRICICTEFCRLQAFLCITITSCKKLLCIDSSKKQTFVNSTRKMNTISTVS